MWVLDYLKVVIGVFGGLDLMYVLIVVIYVMDCEGWLCSDILVFVLFGFVIGEYIKNNVIKLVCVLGVIFFEIDIGDIVWLMLYIIGYLYLVGEKVYDVIFENV